jgi:hypothetical protein
MAFRIQIRRDLASKWVVNNPVLLEGEIGYTTDTQYMKIGDGETDWNNLDYWNGPSTYKVYVALLTQTGALAPVATVLENTLGATPVWTRSSAGNYVGTLSGAFAEGKTVCFYTHDGLNGATGFGGLVRNSNNTVCLTFSDEDGTYVDTEGVDSIEIRVYK